MNRPWQVDQDANLQALRSIDAVHDADPRFLNQEVSRLRRFVRIRRILYYSVLAPFAALSRRSPLLVLILAGLAAVGAFAALLMGGSTWLIVVLLIVEVGAISYHALSVRLATLVGNAADSVGLSSAEIFERWKT